MSALSVFVIDDDKMIRAIVEELLIDFNCEVETFEAGEKALEELQNRYIDLVITDYRMPGINGLEIIKRINKINPEIEVIMITGHGSIESAVEAMKLGAHDYITKPLDLNELRVKIEDIQERKLLINENKILKDRIQSIAPDTDIIYNSDEMQEVINLIGRVSESKSSVLIQ